MSVADTSKKLKESDDVVQMHFQCAFFFVPQEEGGMEVKWLGGVGVGG